MALSRILLGWALVTGWLLGWNLIARRGAGADGRAAALAGGEALLLTPFGALWFGSLGAGAWWLVFGLVAVLREWPVGGGCRGWSPPPEGGRAAEPRRSARASGPCRRHWRSGCCGCSGRSR